MKLNIKNERFFTQRFPQLCIDDREDEFNELINLLRVTAENYLFNKEVDETLVKFNMVATGGGSRWKKKHQPQT